MAETGTTTTGQTAEVQPNTTISFEILDEIIKAMAPLNLKVYPLNRPKSTDSRADQFAVVDLPTTIRRPVKGYDDFSYVTTGVIYLFCRAHSDGTPTIDRQTRMIRSVTDLFPINAAHAKCTTPSVLHRGLDEYNFQVTAITFDIRVQ